MTIININSDLKTIKYQSINTKYEFTYNIFYSHTFFLKEVEVLKYEMVLCPYIRCATVMLCYLWILIYNFQSLSCSIRVWLENQFNRTKSKMHSLHTKSKYRCYIVQHKRFPSVTLQDGQLQPPIAWYNEQKWPFQTLF